ncbi:hypothetical protein BH09SUM1_BH09SUM1_12430 [soil metagenome]
MRIPSRVALAVAILMTGLSPIFAAEVLQARLRDAFQHCEAKSPLNDKDFAAALDGYSIPIDGDRVVLQVVVGDDASLKALTNIPTVEVRASGPVPGGIMASVAIAPSQWRALVGSIGVLGISTPIGNQPAPGQGNSRTTAGQKAGSVTSQGVEALDVDDVRRYFPTLDGTGIKIGVIGDSLSRVGSGLAGGQASGDLPPNARLEIISEGPVGSTDEGRAMMELAYDIAPGASYGFATFRPNQAALFSAINEFRMKGYSIIVDDAFFEDEPLFQPGIVSSAIQNHIGDGHTILTAAGNYGVACYYGTWTDTNGNNTHEFAPGVESMPFNPSAASITGSIVLQSSQPHVADPTNIALFYYQIRDKNGDLVKTSGGFSPYPEIQGEYPPLSASLAPYSLSISYNPALSNVPAAGKVLKVMAYSGVDPVTGFGPYTSANEGPIVAHAIDLSIAVGAAAYYNKLVPETYSSRGLATQLFDSGGNPLSSPNTYLKPNFLSIDLGNNTLLGTDISADADGFPNFGGTSAAAPHAAGVAALIFQTHGGPTSVSQVGLDTMMKHSAQGDYPPDVNRNAGFGTINALAAVMEAKPIGDIEVTQAIYPDFFGQGSVEFDLPNDSTMVDVSAPSKSAKANLKLEKVNGGGDPIMVVKDPYELFLSENGIGTGTTRIASGIRVPDAEVDVTPSQLTVLRVLCASQEAFSGTSRYRLTVDGTPFTIKEMPFNNDFAFGDGGVYNQLSEGFHEIIAPMDSRIEIVANSGSGDVILRIYKADGTEIATEDRSPGGLAETYTVDAAAGEHFIIAVYSKLHQPLTYGVNATARPQTFTPSTITPPNLIYDIVRVNPKSGQTANNFSATPEPLHIAFVPEVDAMSFSIVATSGEFSSAIYDASGNRVDQQGIGANAFYSGIGVIRGAVYYLRIVGFPESGHSTTEGFVTTIASAFDADAVPLVLTDSGGGLMTAQASGSCTPVGDNDYFKFSLPTDVDYPVEVRVTPVGGFDPEFEINDSNGGLVIRRDQWTGGGAEFYFVPQNGVSDDFTIRISRGAASNFLATSPAATGSYTISLKAVKHGSGAGGAIFAFLTGGTGTDQNGDGVIDAADFLP